MSKLSFHHLEPLRFPLINRFYKTYYSAGKAKKDEIIWIGENESGICCCVRFKQFDDFQLLTGMLVHPRLRGEKIGHQLLQASEQQLIHHPCYCFAFDYLESFYNTAGFSTIPDDTLPPALKSRLERYRIGGKPLIPMHYQYQPKDN
ncbi:GNAT family N-acetyltransferase [Photobacterium nomapromontoriensis]|uniref:GNAT family N-acetyltransferase n=1 Tax=Photobacterium nomapromontoriensis TaxID=2910237 RepID=UPI003D10E6E7